ncbi:MAG: amidohydrolase family protein, partial [Actinobacteria bacterium]|nr:amidohydrolase family protein [Actinomycetota bacterium]
MIDAGGLVVSPGFIDLHSHADYTVEAEPAATGQLAQGITSIVTGNCGWSPFPVADLAELRQWSAFLGDGPSWDWRDFAGFAERVDSAAPAVNVLPLVGHIAARIAVLGGVHRDPLASEMLRMRRLVADAIGQGAWGLPTGLIYAPGSFAAPDEVETLVAAAAEAGALYSTHMRDETAWLLAAVDEAIGAAETARRSAATPRLQISHIKAMGPANHGLVPQALARIDAARAGGLDVAADVYPYTASATTLASRLPAWALDGGIEQLLARLAHAETRGRIRSEVSDRFDRGDFDPAGIVIGDLPPGRFSGASGSPLTELARALGVAPAEAALAVLEAHAGVVGIINHAMSEDDVRAAILHPHVAIASDGGALEPGGAGTTHPRAFGTFPRVFARYVREEGLLSIEAAVRK